MERYEHYRGISSVFGGFLIHITFGTFYTLGNVNTYMTSYLRQHVQPNATYATAIWVNAAFMLGQGSVMMFGGMMERTIGARLTCLLGSTIFSGSVALTYFSVEMGFIYVVLTYGLMSGLGVGVAYVAPLVAGMKWFPKRKGLVNGVTVGGFGLGALIFTHVQTIYLNPNNSTPDSSGYFVDQSILSRVPTLFLILGCVYFIVQLIGCLLIFKPPLIDDLVIFNKKNCLLIISPATKLALKAGNKRSDEDVVENSVPEERTVDIKPLEALRSRYFLLMWLMFAFSSQSVQFINTMYKAFGQQFIPDDRFLAFVGSIASVFNACGRIVWGLLLDKSSFKICFISLCLILSSLMMTFVIAMKFESKTLYFIWVLAIFFTFSGLFVIFPTATAQVFGKSYSGTIFGMLFTAPAVTSLFGALLFEMVQKSLGWLSSFVLVAVLTMFALIIMLFFPNNVERSRISK